MYRIAENFRGRNFREFHGFVAIREGFFREIWGRGVYWRGRRKQSAKVFSAKIIFFINPRKFSPLKVFRYRYLLQMCGRVPQFGWEMRIWYKVLAWNTVHMERLTLTDKISPSHSWIALLTCKYAYGQTDRSEMVAHDIVAWRGLLSLSSIYWKSSIM